MAVKFADYLVLLNPSSDRTSPDLPGTEDRLHAGVLQLLLDRPEMPPLLPGGREQGDIFPLEAVDLRGRHDHCRAAIDGVDNGD